MRCASQKMRISELEVEYEDILWFAIDKFHRVIAFTSGVYGHVPEFVCRSKEETILIENYFDNCGKRTEIKHIKGIEFGEKLIGFCEYITQKGIYCFDSYNGNEHVEYYTKISSPCEALVIENVPEPIASILKSHIIDVDVEMVDIIHVCNAY